ncbi:MAG: hypothetical protein GZ090_01395 [Oxalobacteraceae bacterium]|nr:hypothetical protein [Oxalobacteraceae bacterium]
MILQNLTTLASLTLSHDLLWSDEHGWSPVVASAEYTLTGALLIESAARQAGRPITLKAPDDSMAWHTRAIVDALLAWAGVPGQQFLLTLDDARSFTVVFRHHDAPALESKPVRGFASFDADDYWQVTLKFMEI